MFEWISWWLGFQICLQRKSHSMQTSVMKSPYKTEHPNLTNLSLPHSMLLVCKLVSCLLFRNLKGSKLWHLCIFISITQYPKYKIKILHTIWRSNCGNSDTLTIGIRVRFNAKQRSWRSENSLNVVLFLTATTIPWCRAICNTISVHNIEHIKQSCRGIKKFHTIVDHILNMDVNCGY